MYQILQFIFYRYTLLLLHLNLPTSYDVVGRYAILGFMLLVLEVYLVLIAFMRYYTEKNKNWSTSLLLIYLVTIFMGFAATGSLQNEPLLRYNQHTTTKRSKAKTIYKNEMGATVTIDDTKIEHELNEEQFEGLEGRKTLTVAKDKQEAETIATVEIKVKYSNKYAKNMPAKAIYRVDKVTLTTETITTTWFKAKQTGNKKVATVYATAYVDEKTINTQRDLEKLVE